MACGVTRFGVACNNSGTSSHAGLHTAVATLLGKNTTWNWKSPASGQTAVNSDESPAVHKPQVVGQLDQP